MSKNIYFKTHRRANERPPLGGAATPWGEPRGLYCTNAKKHNAEKYIEFNVLYYYIIMTQDLDNKLTIDFNNPKKANGLGATNTLVDSSATKNGLTNVLQKEQQSRIRISWDKLPSKCYNGGNFFFTLNPDPNVQWYTHNTDKKVIFDKYIETFEKIKDLGYLKKSYSVYEYGQGKKNGKIHFHGFIHTTNKKKFEEEIYKVFNEKSNCKHRTLNLKTIKTTLDRQRMQKYLKKETQNKIKLFYYQI
jgi:hypothetical protein